MNLLRAFGDFPPWLAFAAFVVLVILSIARIGESGVRQ